MQWSDFLGNILFRCFFGFLAGKLHEGCQNISLRRQKSNWGKWFFISSHLILDIVISHWTQHFGLWLKFLKRDVNTAFSASGLNSLRKNIVFWNKPSISIYFRILRTKSLDIQQKKISIFKTAFNLSGGKIGRKNVFFGIFTILNICSDCDGNTFESSAKKFLVDSPNCLVLVQKKDSNEVTLFRTFQFQIVSQTLSGKYPAVLSKTNCTSPEEPMKNEVLIWNNLIPKKVFAIWRRSFG